MGEVHKSETFENDRENSKNPCNRGKITNKEIGVSNIESKTLVNELRWVNSTKVKLLKMTEGTPKIPVMEAKSPIKRVETSNLRNKTLVNKL